MRNYHCNSDELPQQVVHPTNHRFNDLTGRQYGRLTVIYYTGKRGTHKRALTTWLCKCDCGQHLTVASESLEALHTNSCGCLQSENASKRFKKHGLKHVPEYKIWKSMRNRCNNPNYEEFQYYGGRGISICPEWDDFNIFYADMGSRPTSKHQIDRIDTNGNYEKSNCRWATSTVQNRNTRRNNYITYNGETHCLAEWAELLGLTYSSLKHRLNKLGWTLEQAFTTPADAHKRFIEYNGMQKSLTDWAKYADIPYELLKDRVNKQGWSLEKALTTPSKTYKPSTTN